MCLYCFVNKLTEHNFFNLVCFTLARINSLIKQIRSIAMAVLELDLIYGCGLDQWP